MTSQSESLRLMLEAINDVREPCPKCGEPW